MKTIKEIEKEIEELVEMFDEEEGSLWASENETYIQEQRDKLKELNIILKQKKEICEMIEEWGKKHILDDELDGNPRKLIDSSLEDWEELLSKIEG